MQRSTFIDTVAGDLNGVDASVYVFHTWDGLNERKLENEGGDDIETMFSLERDRMLIKIF